MRSAGKYGRRKSDWYFPIGLALIIGLAMGWMLDNRAKSEEIARLSDTLQHALELSEAKAPPETKVPREPKALTETQAFPPPPQAPPSQVPPPPETEGPPGAIISSVPGRSPQAP